MGDLKESVQTHLDGVTPEKRRRDAAKLLELMTRVTGESPQLWGSIVGFGRYHYKYQSGREGDAPAAGFAPRKAATTIYVPDDLSVQTLVDAAKRGVKYRVTWGGCPGRTRA